MRFFVITFWLFGWFPLSLSSQTLLSLEGKKKQNLIAAVSNTSTIGYFAVINVKDMKSGQIKAICTDGKFISGALHTEFKKDYDEMGERFVEDYVKKHGLNLYCFSDRNALENIGFFNYNPNYLFLVNIKYDIKRISDQIDKTGKFDMWIEPDIDIEYIAHLLFDRGYLMAESDCFGGTLFYVKKPL